MQPTLPPGWSELERFRRRRGRVTLAELSEITARAHQMHMQELRRLRELHARLDWPRAHPPEILLYTPNQLRQLIRLGNAAEAAAAQPTGSSWRPGPLGAPWHLPDGDITLRQPHQPEEPAGAGGGEWWWWRGWGAGALLLLAALLLVRAADRCFTRNYARSRRRRSEEWPTPNVLATSNRLPLSVDAETSPNEFDIYPSESEASNDMIYNADLPPPYSECADGNKHIHREEPPPPYSACYVAFSNPKDGVPSVTFLNSQRQNMFEDGNEPTSTRFINVQTSTEELTQIAHSSNGFNLDTGQLANNPIGDRIYKLPYFDNATLETDDSDCNVECITDSIECITNSIECVTDSAECINVGPAPIASPDMAIDVSDVSSSGERNETVSC